MGPAAAGANGVPGAAPAGPVTPPGKVPAQRVEPFRRAEGVPQVVWMALILALSLPALLVQLHRPMATNRTEAFTLATSSETARQFRSLAAEDLQIRLNGEHLWDQPPLVNWMQLALLKLTGTDLSADAVDQQVWLGRLASVAMALLMLGAVFWAGRSIGDGHTSVLSLLVAATCPLAVWQSRLASPAACHAAFAALAMAAAAWAIRPLKAAPSRWRQGIGWSLAGLAMGAAFLCAGPLAVFTTVLPVLLVLILAPNRVSHLLGLLAAVLIGVLLAAPWALYVYRQNPQVINLTLAQLGPDLSAGLGPALGHMGGRLLLILALLLPWTLWLIGALVQPFSTSSAGTRTRLFLGWVWFMATAAAVVVLPRGRGLDEVFAILPAAAVLLGQVLNRYSEMASEGRFARFWTILRWPHLAGVLIGAVLVPLAVAGQDTLIRYGLIVSPRIEHVPWMAGVGLGLLMMAMALVSLRWAWQQHPGRTVVAWAIWVWLLQALLIVPVARGPAWEHPLRQTYRDLGRTVGAAPVFWLRDEPAGSPPAGPARDWPDLLLYSGLALPAVDQRQAAADAGEAPVYFLLEDATRGRLWEPGQRMVMNLPDPLGRMLVRYDRRAATPTPATAP